MVAKAVYHAPSTESDTPGTLRVSTSLYRELRKYDIPTLMLHETEPGHHLQVFTVRHLKTHILLGCVGEIKDIYKY